MKTFEHAQAYIHRHARPLDLARFRFHFEGGSREDVLRELAYYQNADGGFGHALEADSWNPASTPIQTWTATEILHEIGCTDASHPIIAGILRYLASGADFNGHFWSMVTLANNDHPHAPWWTVDEAGLFGDDYNPTACLAGFIVRFAEKGSALHRLGLRIAGEACDQLMAHKRQNDMHTLLCYLRMCEYLREAGEGLLLVDAMLDMLRDDIGRSIDENTELWTESYACRPSQFFQSGKEPLLADFRALAACECAVIESSQLPDGSWNIPWDWGAYPKEWALSECWWKADGIIRYLRFLRNVGGVL